MRIILFSAVFFLISACTSYHYSERGRKIAFGDIKIFDREYGELIDNALVCFKYIDPYSEEDCEQKCVTLNSDAHPQNFSKLFLDFRPGEVVLESLAILNHTSRKDPSLQEIDAKYHFYDEGMRFIIDADSEATYFGHLYIYLNIPNSSYGVNNKLTLNIENSPTTLIHDLLAYKPGLKRQKQIPYTRNLLDISNTAYSGKVFTPRGKYSYHHVPGRS